MRRFKSTFTARWLPMLAALILAVSASAQTYQQFDLFPLTLGSYWVQDNGHIAVVIQATDSGGTLSVLTTNWNSMGQPIAGYLRLSADSSQVQVLGFSNPDYIIVDDEMGYFPFVKRPMSLGQSWNMQWNSNGYPTYQTATVTATNMDVNIGGITHGHCTELTVTRSFPNGYTPGQTKWINCRYYFRSGVGCIKRILTSDLGQTQISQVIAWDVKGFTSQPIGLTAPPAPQTTGAGSAATFSVRAAGILPMKYQWRKDGTNLVNGGRIAGATTTNLTISSTQLADSGGYSVMVSNAYGSVTSAVAVLTVVTPPSSFTLLDYFYPMVQGNEWEFDGTDYDGSPSRRIERVENLDWPVTVYTGRSAPRTYTTNLVRLYKGFAAPTFDSWYDYFGNQGALSFWGGDDDSESTRVDGGMHFPQTIKLGQVASVTRDIYENGIYSGSVTIQITALGWGTVTVPAGTFEDCLHLKLVFSLGGQSDTQEEWWAKGIGTIKHRNVPDVGEERLDLVRFSVVAPPRITSAPHSQTNILGATASFTVTAWGTPPLSFHWRKDGVDLVDGDNIAGATTSNLVVSGLEFPDAGSYTVVVANDFGSVTSSPLAVLTVRDALPPTLNITSHSDLRLLNTPTATLAGTASDAGWGDNGIASVTVNGIRATNDTCSGGDTAGWSRTLNLVLGTNKIIIVARDGRGNATTNSIRLLSDTARPTVGLVSPAANARLSNAVASVAGKASDNIALNEVWYQLNAGDWTSASTANGWSNWTASVTLTPGPNTVRAYAVDATGNRSTTNTVTMTYVLSGPLVVGINGKGTINPNYHGKLLEIGRLHSMTATPAVGYAFTNWTGSITTNKALLSFIMQSNLTFTANFVDIQKPVVTITAPTLNQRWSNAVFIVAGKATDNGAVAQVFYQLNGGDWTSASTANAWSNWTASVTLTPGPNAVRAYAVDATGNRSTTNAVNFTYVVLAPLVVGTNGKGTVNPNYNGKLLEIAKLYTMTATPAVGYAFSNWTDAVGTAITNKTMLSFVMQSNLVFNANFADIQKPVVTITAPTLNQRWSNAVFTVAGKATDNGGVAQVVYQLNGGNWTSAATANNWSNWTASVTLTPGPNTLRAYAVDATGNRSITNTVTMTYVLSGPLAVGITGKGTVAPNYNGKLLEIGKPHSMTATPAVGYAFTNWTDAVGTVITNKTMLSFVMQSNLVFNANFADIQKPVVTITAPTLNQRWSNAVFTVAGKATDNGGVAQVVYQLNGGNWTSAATANNWSNWTASVTLTPGPNTLRAYAVDATGNRSITNTVTMTYVMTYALVEYFHPLSVGNEWVYRFTHHSPTPTNSVIRVDSVSHPLTCYRGRTVPTSYVTNVISLYSSYCDYHDGAEVFIEDTWYESYTTNGGLRMWGSDDDPGTIPDPDQERLRVDGGVLLGERLAVGQTMSTTRDLYEDGTFMGAATFSAQLVAQTSVTVPAGTFPDCLHIRVTLSINGAPSSFEEWWAKGIGMVKKTRTSSGGYPQLYELSQFTIASPAAPAALSQVEGPSNPVLALQLERIDQHVSVTKGCLLLRLSGPAGSSVVVESTSDLLNWTPVATNTIPADGLELIVPVDQSPRQFFRARLQ